MRWSEIFNFFLFLMNVDFCKFTYKNLHWEVYGNEMCHLQLTGIN